ncbi:hypothetical protein [Brachybacterium sacelli]|uniref:hypothetical protein n=1 Tax=Brachybacterium sacelli TaxID=173364 RepID=UPI003618648B
MAARTPRWCASSVEAPSRRSPRTLHDGGSGAFCFRSRASKPGKHTGQADQGRWPGPTTGTAGRARRLRPRAGTAGRARRPGSPTAESDPAREPWSPTGPTQPAGTAGEAADSNSRRRRPPRP